MLTSNGKLCADSFSDLNLEKSSLNSRPELPVLGLEVFCTEGHVVYVSSDSDILLRLSWKVCPLLEVPDLSTRQLSSVMGITVTWPHLSQGDSSDSDPFNGWSRC